MANLPLTQREQLALAMRVTHHANRKDMSVQSLARKTRLGTTTIEGALKGKGSHNSYDRLLDVFDLKIYEVLEDFRRSNPHLYGASSDVSDSATRKPRPTVITRLFNRKVGGLEALIFAMAGSFVPAVAFFAAGARPEIPGGQYVLSTMFAGALGPILWRAKRLETLGEAGTLGLVIAIVGLLLSRLA